MSWPLNPSVREHWCSYRRVSGSSKDMIGGLRWIERCRCGRFKMVECKYRPVDGESPEVTVFWYDKDGTLERTTGVANDAA